MKTAGELEAHAAAILLGRPIYIIFWVSARIGFRFVSVGMENSRSPLKVRYDLVGHYDVWMD